MVNLINFSVAPIASPFLSLVLNSDVIGGMRTFGLAFSAAATALRGFQYRLVSRTPSLYAFFYAFFVNRVVGAMVIRDAFLVGGLVKSLAFQSAVCMVVITHPLVVMFSMGFAPSSRLISDAILVGIIPTTLAFGNLVSVCRGIPFRILGSACFAPSLKAIRPILVAMKVFSCGGFILTAFGAMFQWGSFGGMIRAHQKFTFLVSNPGTLARRCPVFLLAFTGVIIPQIGMVSQFQRSNLDWIENEVVA